MKLSQISRRAFIGTAAAASASMALPYRPAAAATLHGDGVQDDTEALQALFDGHQVRVMKPGMVASNEQGTVRLLNGNFRTRHPIRANSSTNLYTGHCSFRLGDGPALPHPFLSCQD